MGDWAAAIFVSRVSGTKGARVDMGSVDAAPAHPTPSPTFPRHPPRGWGWGVGGGGMGGAGGARAAIPQEENRHRWRRESQLPIELPSLEKPWNVTQNAKAKCTVCVFVV